MQCSHGPVSSNFAEELIRGALAGARNRSFLDGECTSEKFFETPSKRRPLSDVPSRYLGGYSVRCDLLDAYKAVQAEQDLIYLLAVWLTFRVIVISTYPLMFDGSRAKEPRRRRQIFVRQLLVSAIFVKQSTNRCQLLGAHLRSVWWTAHTPSNAAGHCGTP